MSLLCRLLRVLFGFSKISSTLTSKPNSAPASSLSLFCAGLTVGGFPPATIDGPPFDGPAGFGLFKTS